MLIDKIIIYHNLGHMMCVKQDNLCLVRSMVIPRGRDGARSGRAGYLPEIPSPRRSPFAYYLYKLRAYFISLTRDHNGRHRSVFFMRSAVVELVAANPAALRSRKLGGCTRKWWLGPLRRAQHHARPNRGGRPGPLLASMSRAQSSTPPSSGRTASSWTRTRGG